ncbi:substrate-binding domain-containing protein [Streptomyces cellulosae]
MPYWAELAEHVLREAAARDCTLLVEVTGGRPEAELEIALGHTDPMADGIILSPLALDDRAAARAANPAPLVLLGERVHDLPCAHVTVDNTAAAREATEHLLARGRRKIGVVGRRLGRTRGVGVGPCRQSGTRDRMGTASRAGDGQRQAWRCETEGTATRGLPQHRPCGCSQPATLPSSPGTESTAERRQDGARTSALERRHTCHALPGLL